MERCKGCIYWQTVSAAGRACHYAFATGRTRLKRGMDWRTLNEGPCPYKRRKAGVKARIDDEKARRMYEAGAHDMEIARAMGVSPQAVRNWRARQGLDAKRCAKETAEPEIIGKAAEARAEAAAEETAEQETKESIDVLIYDVFQAAGAYMADKLSLQPAECWRRLLAAAERHARKLTEYADAEQDPASLNAVVRLAAHAAARETARERGSTYEAGGIQL